MQVKILVDTQSNQEMIALSKCKGVIFKALEEHGCVYMEE